jgi:uncharacterized delta-60 repeat protein
LACAAALVMAAVILTVGLAYADDAGKLDHSFGGDGKVLVKDLTGYAESVTVGHHGRIVAAGFAGNQWGPGDPIAVARLLPDGRLARSFSHDGIKRTHFGNLAAANDVAVTRDGGIVVAGETCIVKDSCEAAVVRYTKDGHLKRSFGDHGKLSIEFTKVPGSDSANSVAIDSHGRFVIAGAACRSAVPGCDVALTRLKRDGSIDRAFTNGSKAFYTDFNPGPGGSCRESTGATSMRLDSQGRVLAAGTCEKGDIGLVRVKPDGHLDRRFGDRGTVRADLGFVDGAEDVGIDSDGRIVVSGAIKRRGFAVARFHSDGWLDRSFGNDGKATAKAGGARNELAIDSRDRIVVAGGGGQAFVFARFKSNGLLDRSFGDGAFAVGKGWGYGSALSVATDQRDRIVASGFKKRRFALMRLHG